MKAPQSEEQKSYTPGPWKLVELPHTKGPHPNFPHLEYFHINIGDEQLSGYVRRADAKLLTAAPEMLDMLYRYANECAECDGEGQVEVGDPETGHMEPCEACQDIRDLIDKAAPHGRPHVIDLPRPPAIEEEEDDVAF